MDTSNPDRPDTPDSTGAGEPRGLGDLARRARNLARAARIVAADRRPGAERAARDAIEHAQHAAQPALDRIASQVRAAASAAEPHLRDAARRAADYAQDHEAELKAAGLHVAQGAIGRNVSPGLRQAAEALAAELTRKPAPADAARPAQESGKSEGSGSS